MDVQLTTTLSPAVVPVLVGPLNALFAAAPGIALALFGLAVTLFKPATVKRLLQLLWSQKIVVVPSLALLVGLFYAWSTLFPSRVSAVSVAVGLDKSHWLAFRGSADRRAYVPDHFATGKPVEDPAHGKINWSFTDGKIKTFYSSPAVVGNRVYITGSRYEYFNDVGGVYSLDAATGELVWAFHDKYRSAFSSPAISGKYLIVGEGLHMTKDSRIFCLDIEQSEKQRKGVKLWDFQTTSTMESSPCIADDRAVFGGGGDGVLCYALEPDSNGKARKLWQLDGKSFPDCQSAPLPYEGKVYFGLGRVRHAICCVDPKTGTVVWQIATPYPTGSVAIVDGKLYVPMGIGDFVNDAASLRTIKQKKLEEEGKSKAEIEAALDKIKDVGEVWCVDIATQKVEWKYPLPATVMGTPAVDGDRLYVGSRDGYLYCLSTSGKLIGKFNTHGAIVSSPSVAQKHVYTLTTTGTLFCLDKISLSPVWTVSINSEAFSSPTVANGHVYVGSNGGGFLCIGQPGRENAQQLWPGALGGKSGTIDGSVVSPGATFAWATESAEQAATPPTAYLSPAAAIDKTMYVGVRQDKSHAVIALAGDDLAKKPATLWTAPTRLPVTISPAASEKCVYFVEGQPGDKDRSLRCVDRQTGAARWNRVLAEDAPGNFILTYDKLLIAESATRLTCLDITSDTPREAWKADVGSIVGAPAIAGDIVAVAIQDPPSVLALDVETHQPLWSKPLPAAPRTGPLLLHGRVWVGTANQVQGLSLVQYEPPFILDVNPELLTTDGLHIACTTASGTLLVINPQTGVALAPIPDVVPTIPALLSGDSLLYATKDSIRRYDLTSNQSTLWTKVQPSWLGTINTPMIMVNAHVLFATDKRGLICMKPRKN